MTGRAPRVLVVDDEAANRKLVRASLGAEGYDTLAASSGAEALEIVAARAAEIDVILLDVMMPGMDGIEVTRRLKASPEHRRIPIVVFTAMRADETRRAALAAGAEELLYKPIDRLELVARLRNLVRLKQASDALAEQNERLDELVRARTAWWRALVDSVPAHIGRLDRDGRFEFINRPVPGSRSEDFLGHRWHDLGAPENRARREQALATVLERGETDTFDAEWSGPDGTPRAYAVALAPIREGDRITGAVLAATNVTAVRRAERELRATQEQLHQAQKMELIGRLAGGVAHDFNNLLTVIISFGGFLRDALAADDPRRDDAEEILRAGERATSLTRQLLATSRRLPVAAETFTLNDSLTRLDKMLRRTLGVDIELCTLLDDDPGLVHIDPGQLEQVLLNLAINAGDAMPGGGTLTFATRPVAVRAPVAWAHDTQPPGDYVELRVSDTGTGIDPAVQEQIFEPFFTTKEKGKGTGLGLATSRGIIAQAGGFITCESEVGRGTTFLIHLPRATASEPQHVAATAALSCRGDETILVVEDRPALLRLVVRALRERGFAVLEAVSAEDALAQVEGSLATIHLVIADVILPGRNGLELIAELQRRRPGLRALATSGYFGEDAQARAVPFLAKPFTPAKLCAMVAEVLATPASAK